MILAANKHQRNRPSRAGQLVGECSAYIPAAHQAQGRAHPRLAGIDRKPPVLTLPVTTSRGRNTLRRFFIRHNTGGGK